MGAHCPVVGVLWICDAGCSATRDSRMVAEDYLLHGGELTDQADRARLSVDAFADMLYVQRL